MELKKIHIAGFVAAAIIIILALILIKTRFSFLLVGIGVMVGVLPFVFTLMKEAREAVEKEEMFLEFSRNLVESVKTGTPISRSIINVKDKSYGVLGEHIKKLANQINLGVPLGTALQVFSNDVNNRTISRAITLIGQAEKSGGEIGEILESVAEAVSTSEKLKKERKAVISTLVVQGYIIFLVFIVIVLVLQFKIIPLISGISGGSSAGGLSELGLSGVGAFEKLEISNSFLYLLLIQGFFSGLTIGKLSENSFKAGIKHSFILMILSFTSSTVANLFL